LGGVSIAVTQETKGRWLALRTSETRKVEEVLRKVFPNTDAYRYNPASIRIRIVDPRFKGKSIQKRDALVEPHLKTLPEATQSDIMNLLTLYPNETEESTRAAFANLEFEDPSPSEL
jgi:hypothetical protein